MTYKQAEDKVFKAYFKNQIKILDPHFCFCGTLSGGDDWTTVVFSEIKPPPYSYNEYGRMEKALFSPFKNVEWCDNGEISTSGIMNSYDILKLEDFEDKLFEGFCAALSVLKEIHISRGEIIDAPVFKKRQLQKV